MRCYNEYTKHLLTLFILVFASCAPPTPLQDQEKSRKERKTGVKLIILGNVQDAGSPHIACKKDCCKDLFLKPDANRKVVSLGIVDYDKDKTYLFEASPDIASQLKLLKANNSNKEKEIPDGIFLTHAHIGHYTGLMYLGKEATNAKKANVYAMPQMKSFLESNGPWSQLVTNSNIAITALKGDSTLRLNELSITPFTVPHRDEFSETVGYHIAGPDKKVLFIPDIDKWSKWSKSIIEEIAKVDYVFIDGTFFDGDEINNRDISEIPHPFVIESMKLFDSLPKAEKGKIHFIHFNHTNPLLNHESEQSKEVLQRGYRIATILDKYQL